jgi:predicted SAM-dependent methyltransferase
MIENDSVSVIYASHVLEYFTDAESFRVLHEWRNKLKTGGILRLAVPNFLALIEVYQQTSSLELISGPILGIWRVSEEKYIQHKALYNFRKLADRLYHIGFIAVREWNWREVFVDELKDFDDYSQAYVPHMNKEHGKLISLNIEAIK